MQAVLQRESSDLGGEMRVQPLYRVRRVLTSVATADVAAANIATADITTADIAAGAAADVVARVQAPLR